MGQAETRNGERRSWWSGRYSVEKAEVISRKTTRPGGQGPAGSTPGEQSEQRWRVLHEYEEQSGTGRMERRGGVRTVLIADPRQSWPDEEGVTGRQAKQAVILLAMESCWLLFVVHFLVLWTVLLYAQEVVLPPTVVGYTGSDVILPCKLRKPEENNVSQMQWNYEVKNNSMTIVIYLLPSNVAVHESPLKDRVYLKNSSKDDYSLVIREVLITDASVYTCRVATFPGGQVEGKTQLEVQDQKPQPPGVLIGIVTAVAVFLSSAIIVACLVIVRNRKTSLLNHSDIGGPEAGKTGTCEAKREEDVVYTSIGLNQPTRSGDNTLPSKDKHAEEDDTTYSQVAVPRPKIQNRDRKYE